MVHREDRIAAHTVIAAALLIGATLGACGRLDVLEAEGQLRGDHHLPAVRTHLLEVEGNHEAAHDAYEVAANLATNIRQQRYLRARAAGLITGHRGSDNDGDRRSGSSGKGSPRDVTGDGKS